MLDSGDDSKVILTTLNELVASCRPEGTAVAQKENGLKQARLARGIAPDDASPARIELERRPLNTPKVRDLYGSQHATIDYSRIGMTTYFAVITPGVVSKQALFPSVSPNATSFPSTAASASST